MFMVVASFRIFHISHNAPRSQSCPIVSASLISDCVTTLGLQFLFCLGRIWQCSRLNSWWWSNEHTGYWGSTPDQPSIKQALYPFNITPFLGLYLEKKKKGPRKKHIIKIHQSAMGKCPSCCARGSVILVTVWWAMDCLLLSRHFSQCPPQHPLKSCYNYCYMHASTLWVRLTSPRTKNYPKRGLSTPFPRT